MLLLLLILAAILIVQEISHRKTSYYQVTKTCRLVGRIVNMRPLIEKDMAAAEAILNR